MDQMKASHSIWSDDDEDDGGGDAEPEREENVPSAAELVELTGEETDDELSAKLSTHFAIHDARVCDVCEPESE